MARDILRFSEVIFRGRFVYLLIFILLLIAIQPIDEAVGRFGVVLDFIVSAILLSAIYVISGKKNHIVIGVLLAAPLLLSLWSAYFFKHEWLPIIGLLCGIAFFAFIIVIILRFIFKQDEISGDLIAGAAVVYLLMAIMWAFAYRVIEIIDPGSFSLAQGHSLEHQFSFQYYSFVTLTTLGYGDIFPISTAAKACAILEAVIGQLYLVITIAWLMGVHISQSMQKKK
jgi:hypothetical protein